MDDILVAASNATLSGLDGDDTLYGDANARLYGGEGDDLLVARGGGDRLAGGSGSDVFRLETSLDQLADGCVQPDVITDFKPGEDRIELNRSIFSRLNVATLAAESFRANRSGAAEFSTDFLLYNTTNGALLYDADGNGAGAAIHFATLSNKPQDVTTSDFLTV